MFGSLILALTCSTCRRDIPVKFEKLFTRKPIKCPYSDCDGAVSLCEDAVEEIKEAEKGAVKDFWQPKKPKRKLSVVKGKKKK